MALPFFNWSRTAASNATADATVNWQEGQLPSTVNDSARAMMASTAAFRDDISGAIFTGGTSTAYTVSSYQVFDTLAHLNGQVIAFTPHVTNGGTTTLNVDSLGAKPLRSASGVEILAGTLITGTPYTALYYAPDAAFYLHGFYGNAYNVPLLGGMDYWGTTAPNSSFIFPQGQAISRTTYPATFAVWGITYGAGDGSTTFNAPDKGGRVSVMKEATATRLTTAGSGVDGGTMGATGGAQNKTLLTANLPPYTPAGSVSVTSTNNNVISSTGPTDNFGSIAGSGQFDNLVRGPLTSTGSLTGTAQGGTSTPFATVQPMIVCNYIIRII